MNDQEFKEYLQRYVDGELEPEMVSEVEQYIKENPLAALEVEKEQNFNQLVKNHIVQEEAPYELREAVVESLSQSKPWFLDLGWVKPALKPVAVGFLVMVFATTLWVNNSNSFPFFTAAIARHVDCLQGMYTMEVKSSDPQYISKWFEGKLGFPVNPPDLSKHGADLTGARLCHLKGRNVAFLIYDYSGKQISAFIVDVDKKEIPRAKKYEVGEDTLYTKSDNGYQSILCLNEQVEGVGCIYVSDIPQDELMDLVI